MADEARLIEKLRAIEALYAGAMTPGEREAAGRAKERIIARIEEVKAEDPPIELQFSLPDPWARHLFLALLRRYKLEPYRYKRQRKSTVMVRMPRTFASEILMPEFRQIAHSLNEYLYEVTERVVAQVLEADGSEPALHKGEPSQLTATIEE